MLNTGSPISDVFRKVVEQAQRKEDFHATTSLLTMTPNSTVQVRGKTATREYTLTPHAAAQIGERLDIPSKYFARMRDEAPELLAQNVNTWFQKKPEKRLIRTLTADQPASLPVMRAFMSDRYRRLDDFDLIRYIAPVIGESDLQVASAELTDTRLYMKFTTPRVQGEVLKGDVVQAGAIIRNSEIGMGSIAVEPFVMRLACTNGMTVSEFGQRKNHAGKRIQGDDEEATRLFSDETLQADDAAFFMKVRDLIKAVTQQESFNKLLEEMRESARKRIDGKPEEVIEILGQRHNLNSEEQTTILRHLIDDGLGLNQWSLVNAVTSLAGETKDYNRSSELERIGGSVLTLDPSQWKVYSAGKN